MAIKVIDPENTEENGIADFMQEIEIMKKIRHKNVVQFIGASTSNEILCIVTEYLLVRMAYARLGEGKKVLGDTDFTTT